jgi:hypothetical protein
MGQDDRAAARLIAHEAQRSVDNLLAVLHVLIGTTAQIQEHRTMTGRVGAQSRCP